MSEQDRDFAKLSALMLAAVRRTCPSWLADDAEDIAQNALMKLHQRLQQTPDMTITTSYLKRVAHSVLIDEIRLRRRRFEGHMEDAEDEQYEVPDGRARVDDGAIGDAVQACLSEQQPDRRRALTLHLLGHNTSEIAQFLSLKVKQAENLVYRALANLRDCLRAKEVAP